jgi:fibronectin-binding autotransporter adhesin
VNNGIVDLKVCTLEFAGGLSVGNNSLLKVSAGLLKINSNSGTPSVGSGAMALISGSGVLQLAGTVSSLGVASPAADRVAISNNSTAAAGLVVSGVNQQVGAISGSGNVQVNAGASLIADSISATALLIGGAAGNPAKVTIAGSDSNGQPLGEGFAIAAGGDLSATGFAALSTSAASLADSGSTFDLNRASDYRAPNAAIPNSLALGNNAVPEPASIALTLAGVLGLSSVALRRRNQKKPRDGRPWA